MKNLQLLPSTLRDESILRGPLPLDQIVLSQIIKQDE